ncbi:MAG: polysaccharide deacetylase family protein, partial [Clostridiales bacterium]|nr:polysaccharide deacetylase family protein [Clostridiales bacterium]
ELSRKFPDGIDVYETDGEYAERLRYEIQTSKNIIEEKLNKEVRFMAWPGGGKNPLAEELAREAGYLAVTAKGKSVNETDDDLFYIYRVGGWSALKILGKHSAALEKLFIRMQLSRGKGKGGILQRFISRIGKIYRGRYSRKRRKKGEVSQ